MGRNQLICVGEPSFFQNGRAVAGIFASHSPKELVSSIFKGKCGLWSKKFTQKPKHLTQKQMIFKRITVNSTISNYTSYDVFSINENTPGLCFDSFILTQILAHLIFRGRNAQIRGRKSFLLTSVAIRFPS